MNLSHLTGQQLSMARHALGLPNDKNTSYRNHYCAAPESPEHDLWEDMVAKGFAIKRINRKLWVGDMFFLTLSGGLAARLPGEHLSREEAQQMREMETTL